MTLETDTWDQDSPLLRDQNSNLLTPNLDIFIGQKFDCFKVYQETKHLSKTQKLDVLEGDIQYDLNWWKVEDTFRVFPSDPNMYCPG